MEKHSFSVHLLVFAAAILCCPLSLAADEQIDYCRDLAQKVVEDPSILSTNVLNPVNAPSCLFQASLSTSAANKAIAPARVSLWNAFAGLSGSQQQGSSLSSSGSTNAVSKPSGPTALIEEFGGANVGAGTSSSTLQWSPGTMLTNLALTGVNYQCLFDKQPEHCISAKTLRDLTPLTLKITGNTSTGTPSMTGTAASSTSTGSAQQVTVNSKGNSGPSFGGLTVQYSVFGSRGKASVNSIASPSTNKNSPTSPPAKNDTTSSLTQYEDELKEAWLTHHALDTCDVYKAWQATAKAALQPKVDGKDVAAVQKEIQSQYNTLLIQMLASPACQPAIDGFKKYYAAILEAETYEYFGAAQTSSAKPELALEYDLNTPRAKPSYSTFKVTGAWMFGKRTTPAPAPTKDNPTPKHTPAQEAVRSYAKEEVDILTSAGPRKSTSTSKQLAAPAKSLAQANAQPWSLTVTGTADMYNAEPSSSIPSASHLRDIQAGAEIARIFSPSEKSGSLRNMIGSWTAALAYSYEDQTSPAILTGPALSDFTGLPSSTTAAYAKRGVIHLGQFRLGFGTGSNLTFPIAVTYSNRTELVVHPTWGLQFGITYNLTSLFGSSGSNGSTSKTTGQ